MHRSLVALLLVAAALLGAPAAAVACSKDDAAYFDGFPDASCLLTLTSTEIDTFGGLRLVTDGAVTDAVWDTAAHFTTGVTYESRTFGTVGRSTLEPAVDAGEHLRLPEALYPLTPATGPGLEPTPALWRDNDGVSDPAVIKTASGYVMYYAGVAEDGSGPAIFRLTSADGVAWTRPADPAQHAPVLQGTDGAFDEHGVYGPDVVHDPADAVAPYKMWFSGRGDTFDQIGYATSTDGITWTKRPAPVVAVGLPGSQDSFSAAHPTVLFDSGLWKMWYEGDDSSKKSIAYATSSDGIAWSKAGAVIESGSGNVEFGVFAPTVWKDGATFRMLVGGRKDTNGELQTKLINYSSADGIAWTAGSIALNTGNGFAASNLGSPEVVPEAGNAIKLYYSGNRANEGDARDRIGYANATGGTASNNPALDLAPRATTVFDSREVSGVAAVRPGGIPNELAGVYHGLNEDGVPRLGQARSADDHTWLKVPGNKPLGAILARGSNNAFDEDGHSEPGLIYDQVGGSSPDYHLYFTAHLNGVERIGYSGALELATTRQPDPNAWSAPAALLGLGSAGTFDDQGVSHPSVIKTGASAYSLYYTAQGSSAGTSIARATSTLPSAGFGARTQLTFTGTAVCDPDGRRDPVAVWGGGTAVDLYYVGLERLDSDGDGVVDETIERTCAAQSADGITFARKGVIVNPSRIPFAADEVGVSPASFVADVDRVRLFTTVTGRDGRTRGSDASSPFPFPGVPPHRLASGWATYQLGDEATPEKDFRFIEGVSTGEAELWMSILQPYSTAGKRYWSDFFPVDAASEKLDLNFLLTIKAVRWQVRLRRGATDPRLDRLTIGHAPVHFAPTGTATTKDITPPQDFALQSWTTLTIDSELFAPLNTGTGGGTVTVLDPDGNTLVAAAPLTVPGETSVALSGIDAKAEPALRVKLDLTSTTGQASPIVRELKVAYAALEPGEVPPADTDGDGVPDSSDACPTVAAAGQADGCPPPPPPPPPDADKDGVVDAADACPAVAAPGSPNGCPIAMTLTASKLKVVFGGSTVLSGTLLRGTLPVPGQIVSVSGQAVGSAAPVVIGTAVTDVAGRWTLTAKPKLHTTYSALLAGVASPAGVTVQVAHKLTLKVSGTGRKRTFSGVLGPKHARRYVTIQRKSGTRWVRLARVRTTRRSTFKVTRRLARGRHRFRVTTAKDAQHLAGRSAVKRVRIR